MKNTKSSKHQDPNKLQTANAKIQASFIPLELEFRRGYYLAVATLVRQHGSMVEAEDLLRAYGRVNFTGIDPYDLPVLKPLAAEIERKRLLYSRRARRRT